MKLTNIIIPDYLEESVPNETKMNRVKRYFIEHGLWRNWLDALRFDRRFCGFKSHQPS